MNRSVYAFAVLLASAAPLRAQEHPRLLYGKAEIPALRARVKVEPYRSMFEHLKRNAETGHWGTGPVEGAYDEIISAHRCAFLYVLTGDDAWARKARGWAEKRLADRGVWGNAKQKGLTLYIHGVFLATAYDACYGAPSWDAAFSQRVSSTLKQQAELIFKSGGTEQNTNAASNWQGLRWSSAGLCMLAGDDGFAEADLDACHQRTARYLLENLGRGGSGWNCEGLGYTYYPMGNGVCPFAVALQRRDPGKDLRKSTPAAAHALWTVYAASVKTSSGLWRPDFADDNPGTAAEGTMGFAFWMCPPELRPGLKWWYERTVGARGDQTYDHARFGTVASILFHPGDEVKEADPMTIPAWRALFADTEGNGMFTFRNRYEGADDVVVQIFAKRLGNRGHSGPDSLSYRICGFDGLWGTGGGRYGPKTNGQDVYWRSQNTVYPGDPDGKLAINAERGRVLSHRVKEDGSGWVVTAAARNNVGTSGHTRRVYVDYSGASGAPAALLIVDSSSDGRVWQHCALETHAIRISGNAFTVSGPDGRTLKGTVLHPPGAELKAGRRPRGSKAGEWGENAWVTAGGAGDGAFVVTLTLQKAGTAAPKAAAEGTWSGVPKGTVTLGGRTLRIDGDTVSD
jgi:hypothetical protein